MEMFLFPELWVVHAATRLGDNGFVVRRALAGARLVTKQWQLRTCTAEVSSLEVYESFRVYLLLYCIFRKVVYIPL
jgi:hypothetical protein